MQVYIGSDHGGYEMKNNLRDYLKEGGHDVIDLGCFSEDSVDYPDIAREVSEKVMENKDAKGVLVCGTGIGMQMTANKVPGVRATVATDEHMAEMSRKHNNANVITLGGRTTELEKAKKIVDTFFTTDFEEGEERHVRRVEKINGVVGGEVADEGGDVVVNGEG
ncbi:ribose 5-phosphate isomerase B [Candidatus Peregrinibacteria bacterium]|jgi:ribose 5-phosphate isomerase B|nr:ribose 5-phosphate isomerase B [Candidatus Peregrinibacteria bacterium]MBT4056146.1 ribose 5-phosphate isomerase B [Candidatus Peregrinibacteria bacterium]